jgi:hypothetical protein
MSIRLLRSLATWTAAGVAVAAASYAAYVGVAWSRYGHATRSPEIGDEDALLDAFMPEYEVVERHHVRVAAPADVTYAAASDVDLQQSWIVRAIFKARELFMGSRAPHRPMPSSLLAQVRAVGWGVLAEVPCREIVMGAVTQPWKADVVFRALPPDRFAAFNDSGYVKIVFTLRSDPAGDGESIFRTETRAMTTDADARAKFRRYWSMVSPGVILIRWMSLGPVKAEAERRARATT